MIYRVFTLFLIYFVLSHGVFAQNVDSLKLSAQSETDSVAIDALIKLSSYYLENDLDSAN